MILYLAVVLIFIVILIHQYVIFVRIYYSNVTLNKLREINSKATLYLSENVKEKMPLEHVILFRGFLAMLQVAIFAGNSIEGGLITFKGIKAVYLPFILLKLEKNQISTLINGNELAKEYSMDIKDVLATSTKAIPFFYFRIIISIIEGVIFYWLIKIGFTRFKKKLANIESNLALYKFRKEEYDMI